MTLRAVLDELDALDGLPLDELGRDELVSAVARAALLGARGNSGVILSQIVRGAAEELASRPGELVDPVLVSAALARAADAAYASLRDPAEGTMLSAIAAMAHRVARELAHMGTTRLDSGATDADQDRLLADVLEHALEAGREAVERGPEQLDALREAGVVDAGAYGLTIIVAGVTAALRGDEAPELEHHSAPAPVERSLHAPHHESSEFRFCTNFVVLGEGLEARPHVSALEAIGDCVLVVGDERTLRVHVHTDEPERAAAVFEGVGEVARFELADMDEQVAERRARLAAGDDEAPAAPTPARCRPVAVATGAGLAYLYEELGARVVDGGATANPSTLELLAGIDAVGAEEAVVLPNSPNVLLAAERAAELAQRPVAVVPTASPQEGLSVLVGFDPAAPAADNAAALGEAVERVATGGVAPSARDDPQGRFRAGEAVGYVDDRLVAFGDPVTTLGTVMAELAAGHELITCLAGEGAPAGADAVEALTPTGVELELHDGGQPAWWWLLSAE
jgi:DAK2 domain fusion protein YloV